MANAKLAPLWLITATPIGLNRWNLIVRNAGYMSSVFVPLGITLKGSRGNEIRDFRFVAQGSPAVDPGEAVEIAVNMRQSGDLRQHLAKVGCLFDQPLMRRQDHVPVGSGDEHRHDLSPPGGP